jgi:hypothetical protein
MLAMGCPVSLRQEAIEPFSERIGCGTAKHTLGAWIEKNDSLIVVQGDDRIHGRTNDRRKQCGLNRTRKGGICSRSHVLTLNLHLRQPNLTASAVCPNLCVHES